MSPRRRAISAAALFVVGSGLLTVFDGAAPRAIGVLVVIASLVVGAWAILTPQRLGDQSDDEDPDRGEAR